MCESANRYRWYRCHESEQKPTLYLRDVVTDHFLCSCDGACSVLGNEVGLMEAIIIING